MTVPLSYTLFFECRFYLSLSSLPPANGMIYSGLW